MEFLQLSKRYEQIERCAMAIAPMRNTPSSIRMIS